MSVQALVKLLLELEMGGDYDLPSYRSEEVRSECFILLRVFIS